MRSALICHAGDRLNEDGLARWMGSISELSLIIRISEPRSRVIRRLRREVERSGLLRLVDIVAFRIVHSVLFKRRMSSWTSQKLAEIANSYPQVEDVRIVDCASVNEPAVAQALLETGVDFAIARCKQLISKRIFSIPAKGVFVLHPGVCPAYRNAHGCFWAMAQKDLENVGTSLLKIDEGVDTGPVYAYFKIDNVSVRESPMIIQERTLFDNLTLVGVTLANVLAGRLAPIDTNGQPSRTWGQPWLSAWLRFAR